MVARPWCLAAGVVALSMGLVVAPASAQELELSPAGDHVAPQIRHEPPSREAPGRQPLTIDAIVTDNVDVKRVTLHYRAVGAKDYEDLEMVPTVGDRFAGVIDASDVADPGIEYYLEAEDSAGNTTMRGFSFSPLMAAVGAPASGVAETTEGPKPWYKKPVVWAIVGGVVVAAAAAGGGGGGGGGAGASTGAIDVSAPTP